MKRFEPGPPAALAAILVITAAWWALALAPLPDQSPAWLEQARLVCFGSSRHTMPTAAGWMLLIGEPIALTCLLSIVWPRVRRHAAVGLLFASFAAFGAVTWRAGSLRAQQFDPAAGGAAALAGFETPPLVLINQQGDTVDLARLRGRPVVVAFAYAHCATVCPTVVHEALAARRLVHGSELLIVTLDPWRDTPSRLPSMARSWAVGSDAHVLSGDVAAVVRVLDEWRYPRSRDEATGEVTHATFVYVQDRGGRLWQVPGYSNAIVRVLEQP